MTRIAALALALLLSGCAGFGGLSALQGLSGQIPGIAGGAIGTIDSTVNTTVIQNAIDQHNLRVSLDQINAAPGMVSQVVQPPVIGGPPVVTPLNPQGTTTVVVTPLNPVTAPLPVIVTPLNPSPPPIIPTPPVVTPGAGPIVTPNAKRSRAHGDIFARSTFVFDRNLRPVPIKEARNRDGD